MSQSVSRRSLLKAALAAPVMAAGSFVPAYAASLIPEVYSHLFKLSLNLYSFNGLLSREEKDLFDMLDFCARHNFDAIDPTGYYFPGYPEVPADEFIFEFKRKAFLLGLDISGTGVRNDFAKPDTDSRQKDITLIKKWVEVAAKLGSPNLRIFAGTSSHEGFSREQVFEWMAKDIRECCDYGARFGVMIALQNHNDFLKTADDVDLVFDLVNSDWLGLNLDIGSYRQKDPYTEIQQNIGRAVTWQIKENVWIDSVEKPTDYVKLFKIIKDSGYRGYLPLETLGPGDPYEKVPNLLSRVRTALEQV